MTSICSDLGPFINVSSVNEGEDESYPIRQSFSAENNTGEQFGEPLINLF